MDPHPRLDGRTLLVLSSHPLRSRLLGQLRLAGPATATGLARELGTNTGATSYHLRRLAEVGLVTETGEGRGRERWWRATHEMHSWFPSDLAGEADGEAALSLLRDEHRRRFSELADQWLAHEHSWPAEWRDAAGAGDWFLTLSAGQVRALQDELAEVLERHRGLEPEPGARRVFAYLHLLPEVDPE
ncbi:helix-turn-helix domain-containing protein [Nocardioides donggukensis]|uniref:helix-turn-helix domain-containing protein n=1 Tax=Nocardioides donggukensis TaxID=2774019 RepID=UPI00191EE078|nr:helix-turn-helix domain-containing protein [Nocardioides donggukensis]